MIQYAVGFVTDQEDSAWNDVHIQNILVILLDVSVYRLIYKAQINLTKLDINVKLNQIANIEISTFWQTFSVYSFNFGL